MLEDAAQKCVSHLTLFRTSKPYYLLAGSTAFENSSIRMRFTARSAVIQPTTQAWADSTLAEVAWTNIYFTHNGNGDMRSQTSIGQWRGSD